jgi:hypothetical protein
VRSDDQHVVHGLARIPTQPVGAAEKAELDWAGDDYIGVQSDVQHIVRALARFCAQPVQASEKAGFDWASIDGILDTQ